MIHIKKWLVLFLITCLPISAFADTHGSESENDLEEIKSDFFINGLKYISNQIIELSCMGGIDDRLCQIVYIAILLVGELQDVVGVIGVVMFMVWVSRKANILKIKLRKFLKRK